MDEYINKKEVLHQICAEKCGNYGYEECAAPQRCLECQIIEEFEAADVAPMVRCKNCIYWKDRHIKLDDGTERPYTEEELQEFCGMVPLSIGINVSSYCTRVKLEDTNFWCGPDDFCSKGARMDGTEDNEK